VYISFSSGESFGANADYGKWMVIQQYILSNKTFIAAKSGLPADVADNRDRIGARATDH